MPNQQIPRRLVAVLYADAVGFSRETQQGLDDTYRRLQACRGIFAEAVGLHRGRLVDQAGDSVLAIFESAANALAAALSVREQLLDCRQRGEGLAYRFGLNLGDVIEDDGGVYGDGVNVAARLESLASAGEVWVSASFRSALGGDSPVAFRDRGSHRVKNIAQPVSAYSIADPDQDAVVVKRRRAPAYVAAALGLVFVAGLLGWWLTASSPPEASKQPSAVAESVDATAPADSAAIQQPPKLIVLPFENMAGDAAQEPFADGITEDLITDLSGVGDLLVISSNTAFSFKGKQVSAQAMHDELKVDYVLEGRVRRSGDALRVSAQLVDARTGFQKWGERFDRKVAEVFAVQDEITASIVEALAVSLTSQEQDRLARRTTNSVTAYDYFLEGQRLSRSTLRENNIKAREAYRQAIAVDPDYGRAYGGLAYTLAWAYRRGWLESPRRQLDRALELAVKAVELDGSIPQTYWSLSYVHLIRKEFDLALAAVRKAVEISPNYADGYGLLALISNGLGRPDDAIRYVRKGMQLNPYYTWDYPFNLGLANYHLGRYEEAISHLEQAKLRNPNAMPVRLALAASFYRAGRVDDAEWETEEIQSISPTETLSQVRQAMPISNAEMLEEFLADLRAAGLPE